MARAEFSRHQLTLPVRLRDDATLDNYLELPGNEALLDALRREYPPQSMLFVYGPPGGGKSHLLQAACHQARGRAQYLPLGDLAAYSPDQVVQDVEQLDLVCLDDIDRVLGDPDWELALFNLYNRAKQSGCRILVAADAAPRMLAVDLEDLRSRLAWGVVFQLNAANDEDKVRILCFRAARRGLQLPVDVARYIVHRAPRDMGQLLSLLDALDEASLAEKRALSIPFVKNCLNL